MKLTSIQKLADAAHRFAVGEGEDFKWIMQDALKRMYDADESLMLYYELHDECETVNESINYLTDDEKSRWLVTFSNESKEVALVLFTSEEKAKESGCNGNAVIRMKVRDIIDTILSGEEYAYVLINYLKDTKYDANLGRDYLEEIAAPGEYVFYEPKRWRTPPSAGFGLAKNFTLYFRFMDDDLFCCTGGNGNLSRVLSFSFANAAALEERIREETGEALDNGLDQMFGIIRKGDARYDGSMLMEFCHKNDIAFSLCDKYRTTRKYKWSDSAVEFLLHALDELTPDDEDSSCVITLPDDDEFHDVSFFRKKGKNDKTFFEVRMNTFISENGDAFTTEDVTMPNMTKEAVVNVVRSLLGDGETDAREKSA